MPARRRVQQQARGFDRITRHADRACALQVLVAVVVRVEHTGDLATVVGVDLQRHHLGAHFEHHAGEGRGDDGLLERRLGRVALGLCLIDALLGGVAAGRGAIRSGARSRSRASRPFSASSQEQPMVSKNSTTERRL